MLNTLIASSIPVHLAALWNKKAAYLGLQQRLSELGLVDPDFTGDVTTPFGPRQVPINKVPVVTVGNALAELLPGFEPMVDQLTPELLESLLEAKSGPLNVEPQEGDSLQLALVRKVIAYMQKKGHYISRRKGTYNIVYVEGMDPDGKLNKDEPDKWNDLRIVFSLDGPEPVVELCVAATTEPGRKYTFSNTAQIVGGAARIAFGQYKAWQRGYHKQGAYGTRHPALVQRGPVRLHRDANRDMMRPGDRVVVGSSFGINQHSTREDLVAVRVDTWSAGCLVGLMWEEHLLFLHITEQDVRYKEDPKYSYISAVLPGNEL